jgi:NitT/TauT family transport system substrate-binding protein
MTMRSRNLPAAVLAAVVGMTVTGQAAHGDLLRLRYSTWVGYGPMFVALEKGLFRQAGVEVELIKLDEHAAAFAALSSGLVDAVLGTPSDAAAFSRPGEEPLACVLVLDDDVGGTGILATKDIRSLTELEGRSVASLQGSTSQFYLNVLLAKAGLTESDLEIVDLTAEDAVTAFLLGEVDAAVTWEPWFSQGKAAGHGHVLTDTTQQPGLIIDCLLTTTSTFERRQADFRALARGWFAALDYIEAYPDEGRVIMAQAVGGGLDEDAFDKTLQGLRFYHREANQAYFGRPDDPGPIYEAAQQAIDVYWNLGALSFKLSPADLVIHGILDE